MASVTWRVGGEVIEREELLDGRCQVVLDGETGADGVAVALSLVWLLGREGEVPLAEGFATLAADAGELNASLDVGRVEASDETGAAAVRATFTIDAAEGDLAAFPLPPGGDPSAAVVACDIEVGAESWSGELRLDGTGGG